MAEATQMESRRIPTCRHGARGAAAAVGQVRLEVEGWHGMQRPLPGARVLAATRLVASSTGGERPPRRPESLQR